MKAYRISKLAGCSLIALALPVPLACADPVPSNRLYNWTYTGVPGGIPNRTTICATLGTAGQSPGYAQSVSAAQIASAINACSNGVVYLNAGTYSSASLGGTINLYKSNVTLRGAGAGQTILTGADIVNLGNGGNVSLGTAITGGGAKGSTQFTVASTANLSVGTLLETDRQDDPSLVVGPVQAGTRNVSQVNAITAISGSTITVRNPLMYDFSTGTPRVKYYYVGITKSSGIENLTLNHAGFSGGYNSMIQYCDSCWLKGVESAVATSYHFVLVGTLNMEIRDSFIHDGGSGPDNSGINFYGNYQYGVNSNAKIENNIFNKDFPAIELNGSSSGFYIGYNYEYGSPSQYGTNLVTWTFDDGHAPFNIMNLYEGNIGEMMGADNYFGGSGYGTLLRNYFTGYNPNYSVKGDAVWLDRLAYYYNIVGNVLGSTNQAPKGYSGCNGPFIYHLGMPNLGNCDTTAWDGFTPPGGYPDPKVSATLLRWGNYDYFNKATQFNPAEIPTGVAVPTSQTIPSSYAYAAKPSWWPTSIPWPPIGPDVTGGNGDTSGHVYKIPAQACWESSHLASGGAFNAATCYGSTVAVAPAITSATSATGTVGTAFSYQVTASNNPTSFAASGLPAGLTINATSGLISGTPTTAGTFSVTLTATNAAGKSNPVTLALTINVSSASVSLFTATSTPATVTVNDPSSVELGVRFSSSTAGHVTALRFYKGPQNVGTHTVHLWSASGALLASATSVNETASGWQTVKLATPVSITPNTIYVASYHSNGYYSATGAFFSSGYTSGNGTLTAPSAGNGVYAYGSAVTFPTSTYNATNYWVDVVVQ